LQRSTPICWAVLCVEREGREPQKGESQKRGGEREIIQTGEFRRAKEASTQAAKNQKIGDAHEGPGKKDCVRREKKRRRMGLFEK